MTKNNVKDTTINDETLSRYHKLLWGIAIATFICVVIFVVLYSYYSIRLNWSLSRSPSDFNEFGVLIGAVLTPLIAAGSLLLFWKTLRLQMKELAVSTKSLKSTAETTQKLLTQERDLFELRQLSQVINDRKSQIFNLKEKVFRTSGESYEPITEKGPESLTLLQIFNVEDSEDTKIIENRLLKVLQFDEDLFKAYLNEILYYGTFLLKYEQLGGDYVYFSDFYDEFIELTAPFVSYREPLRFLFQEDEKLLYLIDKLNQLCVKLDSCEFISSVKIARLLE